MLSGQILSSDTTLNDFDVLDTKNFIPGEAFTLFFRVTNPEKDDLRYVSPATAKITVTINKNDLTTIVKDSDGTDVAFLAGDFSIVSVAISATESVDVLGGNFKFELDLLNDGTQIIKGTVKQGLSKVLDGDC